MARKYARKRRENHIPDNAEPAVSAELSLDDQSALSLFEDPVDNSTFQLVMSLPEKYRTALYLFYYEGYSTAEIAKLLHILPATVRSRLDRGRKQLKQMLLEAEHV